MSKDTGGPAFPVQDAASWQAYGMVLTILPAQAFDDYRAAILRALGGK
jgi:hypothetical protein